MIEVPRFQPWKPKFLLEQLADMKFAPNEEQGLIEGLLPAAGVAFVYGPPKQYKSFVVLSVAFAVARDLGKWAGRKVRSGAVIYVGCEGAAGVRKRIAAIKHQYGISGKGIPFYFVDARPNFGADQTDANELSRCILEMCGPAGVRPAMIVIDTLVRTIHGANENAEGAANFLDNAELIANSVGCLVLVVHHMGKNSDAGMRGSSALLGGADSVWKVTKTEGLRARIQLEDAKDLETGLTWTVDLTRHAFDVNQDGTDVASLVVETVGEPVFNVDLRNKRSAARNITPALRSFLSALDRALHAHGQSIGNGLDWPEVHAVAADYVRQEFLQACELEAEKKGEPLRSSTFRSKLKRELDSALDRELIVQKDLPGYGAMLWRRQP